MTVENNGPNVVRNVARCPCGAHGTDRDARILVEQLRAVDVARLGDSVGRLSAHQIHALDAALEAVLGI
jgi:mRNA-degrading endonuclease toxin of MazEF toxin-antitoxin module